MASTAVLVWGLLFSSIGLGYCVYGRRQGANVPLACGLALLSFPYFVPSVVPMVGIGSLLVAMPFLLRR